MFRTKPKAEEPAVHWVTVVAESFWHDDGRFLKAGTGVSRDDPAVKQNPQFFKRVLLEEV